MLTRTIALAVAFAACLAAAPRHGGSNITLQKRLHVNTLITEPGTAEIDWASLYSLSTATLSMPAAVKYTPEGHTILWGRTEYSVAFDSIVNADPGAGRVTGFSQAVSLASNSVLFDGERFDIALAPQATFFRRDESGARLGAALIARYDAGRNSIGAALSWSGATHSSSTNPAGIFDAGLGYGRRLAAAGAFSHLTAHGNLVWERATGAERVVAMFEGCEYQVTGRVALDISGQHVGLPGGSRDHQLVFAVTLGLGKLK
ncbi:MAG: hypothetical protein ACRD8O_10100 [Bryobacteraceae bacterium]